MTAEFNIMVPDELTADEMLAGVIVHYYETGGKAKELMAENAAGIVDEAAIARFFPDAYVKMAAEGWFG